MKTLVGRTFGTLIKERGGPAARDGDQARAGPEEMGESKAA